MHLESFYTWASMCTHTGPCVNSLLLLLGRLWFGILGLHGCNHGVKASLFFSVPGADCHLQRRHTPAPATCARLLPTLLGLASAL